MLLLTRSDQLKAKPTEYELLCGSDGFSQKEERADYKAGCLLKQIFCAGRVVTKTLGVAVELIVNEQWRTFQRDGY